jgi:hypothetical protein
MDEDKTMGESAETMLDAEELAAEQAAAQEG